ncbi:enterochelin esterase [Phototrophicus methaneseepsis]|uniref:Enterochelin esterase n=1 Tax=Phototrophicus methaneseepsis TaxID=2710758 RepID=A0A7S8IE40_9CHLR|nr:enterochelin esterase [Phototrophicus methaneseepsis]QPC83280.1 enterochelin esterase [Phototrophicus methaneseepsis]
MRTQSTYSDTHDDALISPCIQQLKEAFNTSDNPTTLIDDFWAEVTAQGAPLVEPIDGDADYCFVTFLWRAKPGTQVEHVLVMVDTLTDKDREDHLERHLMQPIAETDVWYKTYRLRHDHRARYQFYVDDGTRPPFKIEAGKTRPGWISVLQDAIADPLNPRTFPATRLQPVTSILELPNAPASLWQYGPAKVSGEVVEHVVASEVLSNERPVWVYTPPGYTPEQTYGVLVLLDGNVWQPMLTVSQTLDALIAEGLIPPLVAVMPSSIDLEIRWQEMTCSAPFVDFLRDELLPWARENWSMTDDPARTIISGQSLGGLTSAYAAFMAPEVFGNVLSLSGSFWWRSDSAYDLEAEWLSHQFAITPKRDVRFYVAAGLQEWHLLQTNRHLRDVLLAKGYELTYKEYNGGHDYLCWSQATPDGLVELTRHWADSE